MRDVLSSTLVMPLAMVLITATLMGMVSVYRNHATDSRVHAAVAAQRHEPDAIYGHVTLEEREARVIDAELMHLTATLTEDLGRLFGLEGAP